MHAVLIYFLGLFRLPIDVSIAFPARRSIILTTDSRLYATVTYLVSLISVDQKLIRSRGSREPLFAPVPRSFSLKLVNSDCTLLYFY